MPALFTSRVKLSNQAAPFRVTTARTVLSHWVPILHHCLICWEGNRTYAVLHYAGELPVKSDGLPAVQLTFNGPTTLTKTNTLLDVSKITTTGETAATGIGVAVSPAGKDDKLITMDGAEGQVYIELATKSEDTIKADFNARYKSFADAVTAGPADADMTVNILYR
jgi:hypothetical protein